MTNVESFDSAQDGERSRTMTNDERITRMTLRLALLAQGRLMTIFFGHLGIGTFFRISDLTI